MSVKKAQKIVNELEDKYGFFVLSHETGDLEIIKDMLEKFLDCGVDPEDLVDPEELSSDDGVEDDDEEEIDC